MFNFSNTVVARIFITLGGEEYNIKCVNNSLSYTNDLNIYTKEFLLASPP